MNKKILIPFLALALFIFMPFVNAASLNVKTLDASITNKEINVSGTTDNGVLAVAIMIYDETGNLVTMQTTSVDSSSKYSDKITVPSDETYIVKVANYDGGNYISKTVTSHDEAKTDEANPKTYDGIMIWTTIGLVSVIGIAGIIYYRKKIN